jgi:hypothetical protein
MSGALGLGEIEQSAQVAAELSNAYVIGALTTAAAGAPESGAAVGALLAIRTALAGSVKAAGKALAKDPKQWSIALGIAAGAVAGSAGLYSWMTEDQQIALETIRTDAALKAEALALLPPEDRAKVAGIIASQRYAPPSTWMLPVLAIGGAAAVWWFFFRGAK